MRRCYECFGYIWPWQHYGFLNVGTKEIRWHAEHRHEKDSAVSRLLRRLTSRGVEEGKVHSFRDLRRSRTTQKGGLG